jgi:hypothetical protein
MITIDDNLFGEYKVGATNWVPSFTPFPTMGMKCCIENVQEL